MYMYWTPEQRRRLDTVSSLAGAGDLAVEILSRMRENKQVILQVCGPMTSGGLGSLQANMARFERAIIFLETSGFCVFNQIPFQGAMIRLTEHHTAGGTYCMDILEVFYRKVFESGHVGATLFLPGWETSTGARWERKFVNQVGIKAHDFPESWLRAVGA